MPKTISELEAQRAKILQEIESKAGSLNTSKTDKTPSLNEWLNAAEEVMPEQKTANKASQQEGSYSSKILKTSHSNTASSPFFSIVILLTLFLTLVGVIYIVYSTLNKDISAVSVYKEQSTQQINDLQQGLDSIQKSIATGGNGELFSDMEKQVAELKQQVVDLNAKVAELESQLAKQTSQSSQNPVTSIETAPTPSDEISNKVANNQLVTEEILDKKLKLYYTQLEEKLDQKLESLIKLIPNADAEQLDLKTSQNENTQQPQQAEQATEVAEASVSEVVTPELPAVADVSSPKVPVVPNLPKIEKSKDEKWLIDQPRKHYILQLASMPTKAQIERVKQKNGLQAKIISQTREGVTNFILVSEAFAERAQAQKFSAKIKADKGISPWIRQVEDITRRVK